MPHGIFRMSPALWTTGFEGMIVVGAVFLIHVH
jgi:hypothetical protein